MNGNRTEQSGRSASGTQRSCPLLRRGREPGAVMESAVYSGPGDISEPEIVVSCIASQPRESIREVHSSSLRDHALGLLYHYPASQCGGELLVQPPGFRGCSMLHDAEGSQVCEGTRDDSVRLSHRFRRYAQDVQRTENPVTPPPRYRH